MTTLVFESTPPGSLDMRVEDFLDDRLQSAADIDSLDELLASIDSQRDQLQSQLEEAIRALEDARRTALQHQASLTDRIDGFNQLQQSIDLRVRVAAESDAPSEAIARLQRPMRRLHTVDLARRYLALLRHVESLRAQARAHLPDDAGAALEPYVQLRELTIRLKALPGAQELHLVAFVEAVADALRRDMRDIMAAELEAALAARHWPRVDPQSQMDDHSIACCEKLLHLQLPEIVSSTDLVSLLPVDVMAAIFVAEFRFHFLGDKPTSNLHAVGSHCFPWFLATIDKWSDFFRDNLGHLLADKFRHTPVTAKTAYLDPVCALVTAMLPVMREKVRAVASEAVRDPAYLGGFVSQLLAFDDEMRTRFDYDEARLAADVLDHHFDAWFRVERSLALERFEAIMESQDARRIDYDYAPAGKMKPTFAAVRVLDLLRAVTSKYERLRKLRHKTRFLVDIQLDILDGYHDRLRGSLEAYQSMTSTLGRTLHGATKEQLAALEGTGALETLCKVIGSADRVASTLSEWSDDEFFASLWEELQAQDATKPSSHAATDDDDDDDDDDDEVQGRVPDASADSAIFDETVSAYTMRRKAAEELLISALADSHSKAFRAYLHQAQWTTVGEAAILDDPSQLSVTPELDEPLRILKRNLDFLSRALSTASFRRVWHRALDWLQDMLWNGVLMRQSFTTLGAAQFLHDGSAIFALVDRYMTGGGPSALEALCEGMRLLNLPVVADGGGGGGGGPVAVSLKEASDRAFTNNDEARRLLEVLGFDALTPMNARQILERRVENGENVGW
ncbi:hypothetical protein L249_7591 [Ophiocordyceps polyrhachis-furcata BCC 54312]|uniref:RINT-1 family protein n=1 Tax=Ophiocordyceps polyrhachis-furcata BCC 54312 TaxID=1330021 RepID=A0A367LA55_9HYPO|nr:hypothetical protein L249_7591 [Ophiocordyceps polyrhachis-furcata BCC 54312]